MAQAMLFMYEYGMESYTELHEKASNLSKHQDELLALIKADEDRIAEIAVMKKHIINYAKAKEVFAKYKASGYNQDFFDKHSDLLLPRRAAKEAFDEYKKIHGKDAQLPKVKDLFAEYAEIMERKKKNYTEYRKLKKEAKDWQIADAIVQMILEDDKSKQEQEKRKEERAEQHKR